MVARKPLVPIVDLMNVSSILGVVWFWECY